LFIEVNMIVEACFVQYVEVCLLPHIFFENKYIEEIVQSLHVM